MPAADRGLLARQLARLGQGLRPDQLAEMARAGLRYWLAAGPGELAELVAELELPGSLDELASFLPELNRPGGWADSRVAGWRPTVDELSRMLQGLGLDLSGLGAMMIGPGSPLGAALKTELRGAAYRYRILGGQSLGGLSRLIEAHLRCTELRYARSQDMDLLERRVKRVQRELTKWPKLKVHQLSIPALVAAYSDQQSASSWVACLGAEPWLKVGEDRTAAEPGCSMDQLLDFWLRNDTSSSVFKLVWAQLSQIASLLLPRPDLLLETLRMLGATGFKLADAERLAESHDSGWFRHNADQMDLEWLCGVLEDPSETMTGIRAVLVQLYETFHAVVHMRTAAAPQPGKVTLEQLKQFWKVLSDVDEPAELEYSVRAYSTRGGLSFAQFAKMVKSPGYAVMFAPLGSAISRLHDWFDLVRMDELDTDLDRLTALVTPLGGNLTADDVDLLETGYV